MSFLVVPHLRIAFDTIDHALWLQRCYLENCCENTVLNWFSSYSSCRFQQIRVGHSLSVETFLLSSVEFRRDQCSILSSFLFTPDSWQNSFISFALTIIFLTMIQSCTHAYRLNLGLR